MKIHFEKASFSHEKTIFSWLEEPHIKEFWDNSPEHREDIRIFMGGRKEPSNYFYGTTMYWVGFVDGEAFCFLLSDILQPDQTDLSELQKRYMSKNGHTISLDFGIGNKNLLGQGLAAPTLKAFVEFYHKQVDPKADTFFIDPDLTNPRAKHVYEKAGFVHAGDFIISEGVFTGRETHMMIKRLYSC